MNLFNTSKYRYESFRDTFYRKSEGRWRMPTYVLTFSYRFNDNNKYCKKWTTDNLSRIQKCSNKTQSGQIWHFAIKDDPNIPDDFNVKLTREAQESYIYWIDVEEKKKTLILT